uniref:Uncharacterized protein n=1 Tax=Manihot esculenta TaxID=3983 RepID=A0A2C9W2C3_MANES
MANTQSMPLISILVALFLVSSSLASTDVPFIVANKKATLNRLKSGAERVSVSIDIYNQGTSLVSSPFIFTFSFIYLLEYG